MRPLLGFVLLHGLFVIAGWSILRGLGVTSARPSRVQATAGIGPAMLLGVCVLVPIQAVLLVLGVALLPAITVVLTLTVVIGAELMSRRRLTADDRVRSDALGGRGADRRAWAALAVLAAAYVAFGVWALAGLPTVLDDARIWSLKGLTLTYHHALVADIFQNQGQAGGHPIYPLFQPALEALVFQAMGSAQLRFVPAELWVLFIAAVWTSAWLIARRLCTTSQRPYWLTAIALLALTPAVITNLAMGYADVTASVLLAVGTVSLGLYLSSQDRRLLAIAAIALAAAANTKDEELLASILTLAAAAAIDLGHRHSPPSDLYRRARSWIYAAAYLAVLVLPWRLWTHEHHLTDSVQPPIPQALSPAFILHRPHQLNQTAAAMLHQTLSEYGWLFAIFLLAAAAGLRARTTRRIAAFYLTSTVLSIISLLWLYTTTRTPLSFLIPTSLNRTVDVFMLPCAMATAHLIAHLSQLDAHHQNPQPKTTETDHKHHPPASSRPAPGPTVIT